MLSLFNFCIKVFAQIDTFKHNGILLTVFQGVMKFKDTQYTQLGLVRH